MRSLVAKPADGTSPPPDAKPRALAVSFLITVRYLYFILALTTLLNCTNERLKTNIPKSYTDTIHARNETDVAESFHSTKDAPDEYLSVDEYMVDRVNPIKSNFKKINSIKQWTSVETVELSESTEGGEAKFYYQGKDQKKIVTHHYGETFQLLTEYYFLDGQLSFVFEKRLKYNRPLYYDTLTMKENNDTEAFDISKSEVIEDRSYFENGVLFHQENNQDCGSPFATSYLLDEKKRIGEYLDKLLQLRDANKKPNR